MNGEFRAFFVEPEVRDSNDYSENVTENILKRGYGWGLREGGGVGIFQDLYEMESSEDYL